MKPAGGNEGPPSLLKTMKEAAEADNAMVLPCWKSHTNLTHPGKYFRPSKVKIMKPTSPK